MYVNKLNKDQEIRTDSSVCHACTIMQHKHYALCFQNDLNKNISLCNKIQVEYQALLIFHFVSPCIIMLICGCSPGFASKNSASFLESTPLPHRVLSASKLPDEIHRAKHKI